MKGARAAADVANPRTYRVQGCVLQPGHGVSWRTRVASRRTELRQVNLWYPQVLGVRRVPRRSGRRRAGLHRRCPASAQNRLQTGTTTYCGILPRGVLHVVGAGDGTRTRDNLLGRQELCQLSYTRIQASAANARPRAVVGARGFEPPTPASQTLCATRLRYAPPTVSIVNLRVASIALPAGKRPPWETDRILRGSSCSPNASAAQDLGRALRTTPSATGDRHKAMAMSSGLTCSFPENTTGAVATPCGRSRCSCPLPTGGWRSQHPHP